jgi:ribosomal protein L21E
MDNIGNLVRSIAPLSPGTRVRINDPTLKSKLDPVYDGDFEVVRKNRGNAYVLKNRVGDQLPFNVPIHHLKVIPPSSSTDSEDDAHYVVEKILKHRLTPSGAHEYLVKWKGYSDQSWEPQSSFDSNDPIRAYWKRSPASALADPSSSLAEGNVVQKEGSLPLRRSVRARIQG